MFQSDKTWEQWWFLEYSSDAKLMYLYFCTKSNIFGISKHSLKKTSFEVGLSVEKVTSALKELDNEITIVFDG